MVGRRKCTACLLAAHIGNSTRQVAPIGAEFRITDPLGTGAGDRETRSAPACKEWNGVDNSTARKNNF